MPYTRVIRGNRFFVPTPAMRRLGFVPLPLGPDNESARRRGLALYERWTVVRKSGEHIGGDGRKLSREEVCHNRTYPRGSIGEAWQKWIRSDEWANLAPSTRNKIWWEAWNKRIEPVFADALPDHVTMEDISRWRAKIAAGEGLDAAHKALKIWRALWRVMRAMRFTQLSDPSEKVVNVAPPPRHQRFTHREAMRLAKRAWREGFRGLACIIVTAWDTGFAPKDCRTLRARHSGLDKATGHIVFDRSMDGREKTGVAVIGTLSRFGDWIIARYFSDLKLEMTAESFLFRMRGGAPYGESRLGNDFARIREIEMPGDKRQLRDMRRSGVMEAFAGDADPKHISEKFGNSIDRSALLFRTYNPVDIAKVKMTDTKRLAGRKRLAEALQDNQPPRARKNRVEKSKPIEGAS